MCTIIIYRSAEQTIIASNRDENPHRQCLPPDRHWPENPNIIAGLDLGSPARGSWLGFNENHQFCAALVNFHNTLGVQTGKNSRGTIVLDALNQQTAKHAASYLQESLNPHDYREFFLLMIDRENAYLSQSDGEKITLIQLDYGYHLITPTGYHRPDWTLPTEITHAEKCWEPWIEKLDEFRETGTISCTVSSALMRLEHQTKQAEFLYSPHGPVIGHYQTVIQP